MTRCFGPTLKRQSRVWFPAERYQHLESLKTVHVGIAFILLICKWLDRIYNPGQNFWDTNVTARQNEAFSISPPHGAVLTLIIQVLFEHNQHCLAIGEMGTAEIGSHNNIPKLFQEVEYEFI